MHSRGQVCKDKCEGASFLAHASKGFRGSEGQRHGLSRERGGAAGERGAGPLLRF